MTPEQAQCLIEGTSLTLPENIRYEFLNSGKLRIVDNGEERYRSYSFTESPEGKVQINVIHEKFPSCELSAQLTILNSGEVINL